MRGLHRMRCAAAGRALTGMAGEQEKDGAANAGQQWRGEPAECGCGGVGMRGPKVKRMLRLPAWRIARSAAWQPACVCGAPPCGWLP